MTELLCVRGPMDDEQLGWIARLYGPADAKYASIDYLRHQFVENPFGWSANVFAVEHERAVGHCGVVPFRARRNGAATVVGKLEGLAVEPEHRGRRADGGSVASDLLSRLYEFAHEQGMPLLFGLAAPPVAAVLVRAGCRTIPSEAPAYVLVTTDRRLARDGSRRRQLAAHALAPLQRAVLTAAYAPARLALGGSATLGIPSPDDAALAAAEAGDGEWTISGADAWDWYAGSGILKTLEISGRFGSRAIVRHDHATGTALQIVAWQPRRPGRLPAVLLLGAAARLARSVSAPTLRFQPWLGRGGDGTLTRTCRLLGFVKRAEADLLLHIDDGVWDDAVVRLTPFFYATF